MTSIPRLEIDLEKISHNARCLVERLAPAGISVTGITKATLGSPAIAAALIRGGVAGLGDSRIENLEMLYRAGVPAPLTLVRSPMPSQAARVVACADTSYNTEPTVLARLSDEASKTGRMHGVVLMVELGDLREGIMPADVDSVVRDTLRLPNLTLEGIGANLACRSGVSPDARNMAELSAIAGRIETDFDIELAVVSGGNSANMTWVSGESSVGRINNLRLGEAILLGREPLRREPLARLHLDAFTLVAEVIESKTKPAQPWGEIAESAFGVPMHSASQGQVDQTLVALGRQDADPSGLRPPTGMEILGSSSDHLVLASQGVIEPGTELEFRVNYSALVGAMTSQFVTKVMLTH